MTKFAHRKRGTIIPVAHVGGKLVPTKTAMERFVSYCRFDPCTGCVLWTGGTTQGQGHHVPYGAFWFEGKRWSAHRWAAKYIHGLDIEGLHVDHHCPYTGGPPNTLCVEHLQAVTNAENVRLQHARHWILVQVGVEEAPEVYQPDPLAVPWFSPPAWFAPYVPSYTAEADCPF